MLQQRLADFFPTIQALLKAGLRYTTEDLQMEYKAKRGTFVVALSAPDSAAMTERGLQESAARMPAQKVKNFFI